MMGLLIAAQGIKSIRAYCLRVKFCQAVLSHFSTPTPQ